MLSHTQHSKRQCNQVTLVKLVWSGKTGFDDFRCCDKELRQQTALHHTVTFNTPTSCHTTNNRATGLMV